MRSTSGIANRRAHVPSGALASAFMALSIAIATSAGAAELVSVPIVPVQAPKAALDGPEALEGLEGLPPRELAARASRIAAGGPSAAHRALEGFERAGVLGRRARAWIAFEAGGAEEVSAAIALLRDGDAGVREELLRFLGRPDLGAAQVAERADALLEQALSDPEPRLRSRAVEALADLDQPEALAALERGLDRMAPPERVLAAQALASRSRAREALFRRLVDDWPATRAVFDDDLVRELLPALARALVDVPELALDARTRAVLRIAARHPDPRLARAAGEAFGALFARLELYGEPERGERLLEALASDGWPADELAFLRARAIVRHASDARPATALARSIEGDHAGSARDDRLARAKARLLVAEVELATASEAAGANDAAVHELDGARELLDGLLAERVDRGGGAGSAEHVAALELEASLALAELCFAIAPSVRADASSSQGELGDARAIARRVHALSLAIQGASWRARRDAPTGLDALLDADLSPFQLALDATALPAWPVRRALAAKERVAEALGAVAAWELPGFAPEPSSGSSGAANASAGDASDPLADPERRALYEAAQLARLELLQRELNELSGRLLRASLEDPCGPDPDLAERAAQLYFEREDAVESLRSRGGGGPGDDARGLLELRVPSGEALALARAWRDEGRPEKARAMLERMRGDLDRSGAGARFLWGIELEAEIEMALGATWSDENEGARAEAELEKAVERLQALEDLANERKLGPRAARRVAMLRASALVSLAVNANVKEHDPAKALAYFERAWALRQDEFMRVLRACYRARAGRADEARSMLREIPPSPLAHYNMACTYALCGDKDVALDFLRRELEENQVSPGARAKQKTWARSDPDLASLRGDPRFEALVAP